MAFDDQAVAIITSADGASAHLAEQVGNKLGVPVLTLSTDTTTTEINLPWIFRLGPTDAAQARAFARDIYQARKLQRVALLTENDHDGRVGDEEFEKAARAMNAPTPTQITIEPDGGPALHLAATAAQVGVGAGSVDSRLRGNDQGKSGLALLQSPPQSAQAVVIWTDAAIASRLVALVREELPLAPLYLCRKAAQGDWSEGDATRHPYTTRNSEDPGIWTVAPPEGQAGSRTAFEQRYRQRYETEPGMGAAQAYDAVRLLASSLRQSGPNRARLRDALAGVSGFPGASGIISFDHAGNDTSQVTLLRLN
jgi:branched-chain amino acid transport system substrate-binding protein